MAEAKNIEERQDNIRINIKSKYERNYWTNSLCISENKLTEAVKEVGPLVRDIRNYLNRDGQDLQSGRPL